MPVDADPLAPDTEYHIEESETARSVDGYSPGEPKQLVCDHCGAAMFLTAEPTPGVWALNHAPACPNASD